MSNKTVYFYRVSLFSVNPFTVLPINQLKPLIKNIFETNNLNNALRLTSDDAEPMILDIIQDNDQYLFARLNKKRLNNTLQKRDYDNLTTGDVLTPEERESKGIELFTYCILGYKHGILSIVNAKGAPNIGALNRIFEKYNAEYNLEMTAIPNSSLLEQLIAGRAPQINRIVIDMPTPNAQVLQEVFNLNDSEILQTVQSNSRSIVFEIAPNLRGGALMDDKNMISRIIDLFRQKRGSFNDVKISAKSDDGQRQMCYDLYEEFFKYEIYVPEYHKDGGQTVEYEKQDIQNRYRSEMAAIYDQYKVVLLGVSDRL